MEWNPRLAEIDSKTLTDSISPFLFSVTLKRAVTYWTAGDCKPPKSKYLFPTPERGIIAVLATDQMYSHPAGIIQLSSKLFGSLTLIILADCDSFTTVHILKWVV